MPKAVAYFERLTYASLVIAAIVVASSASRSRPMHAGLVILVGLPVSIGLMSLMVWLIARRRKNWARWLYVIFFVGGALLFINHNIIDDFQKSVLIGRLNSIEFAMQAGAIVLLFTAGSREWFRQGGAPSK
jgi:hypothetical protein